MENKLSHRQLILDILESAVANVQKHEEEINDLNVFPVPDGDTGSNMMATLVSAWNNISDESEDDVTILADFSKGALLGARGNSGVITSQIIKGLSAGVEEVGRFSYDAQQLRIILKRAKEFAYKSVAEPVEGTILSVVRALDEGYNREATNVLEALDGIIDISKKAVEKTPEQLAVLKEAGVVDSGAFGFVKFIEGAILALQGNGIKLIAESSKHHKTAATFQKADPTKNIGYCTEFILTLKEPSSFNKEEFKTFLESKGDSIVMIAEDDILKVHVHAKKPGEIFNEAQKYGEFSNIKADNMATQTEEAGHSVEGGTFNVNKNAANELGVIAVSNGAGLDKEFASLGVDAIVSGGQSMNPSVEDMMEYISKLPNDKILILPNNSNIILTAETVKKNVTDKEIFVLPTKSLSQGIVALHNINKEMINFEEFSEEIIKEFKSVPEGQITIAIRDAKMNGVDVKKGQYIAIKGKKIFTSTDTFVETFKLLADAIIKDGSEVLNFLYNDDVNADEQVELRKWIKEAHPDIEFEIKYGGQAVYHAIMFGEE